MKRPAARVVLGVSCAWISMMSLATQATAEESLKGTKPNIVLFFIDDMGWRDWSGGGSDYIETHNIDRIAEEGVQFTQGPDHNHFAPSLTAASMGIHCYTEKPLTWSVREAQLLAKAYQKNTGVVTQMGNQGHAKEGWRLACEFVQQGAIGEVTEFHTWTNRPGWPQGGDRPDWTDPVPSHLDCDAWIGSAPMRPFAGPRGNSPKGRGPYHPFNWRGVVDFGSGALGDMACHTTDGIYAIMNPGYAATAEPIVMTGPCTDQYPSGMVLKNTYRGFNLSSLLCMVTADELKAAGVKATVKSDLVIEDFKEDWEKGWFAKGAKSRKTFKLRSPQHQPPPNCRLGLEVQSEKRGRMLLGMEREKESYRHTITMDGDSKWRKVVLSPTDFKDREGETLMDWNGIIITLTGDWEWDDLKMRNLTWIRSQ